LSESICCLWWGRSWLRRSCPSGYVAREAIGHPRRARRRVVWARLFIWCELQFFAGLCWILGCSGVCGTIHLAPLRSYEASTLSDTHELSGFAIESQVERSG